MEVGGADTLTKSLRAVRIGGHVAIIGALSGPASAETSVVPVLMQNLRLNGIFVGNRDMFEAVVRGICARGSAAGGGSRVPLRRSARSL